MYLIEIQEDFIFDHGVDRISLLLCARYNSESRDSCILSTLLKAQTKAGTQDAMI